jgi:hypothetical protein
MDNPDKLVTFGTRDSGRRQKKNKKNQKNKTHNTENQNDKQHGPNQQLVVSTGAREG